MRAGFVGSFTTALGVGAHAAAGGMAPSLPTLAAVAGGVTALSWALSGRRWTPRTLLAAFLLTQVAVHLVSMVEHPMAMGHGPAMLLSHAAAAAILVLTVPRAEAALLSILDHLALRALRITRAVSAAPSTVLLVAAVPAARGVDRTLLPLGRAPPASA